MAKGKISIIHYAGPPIIGGVESTIYHHARLLSKHGYPIQVLAGRGEKFDSQVTFTQIDLLDSRHPEILEVGRELSKGFVSNQFNQLKLQLIDQLGNALADSQVNIVHNAVTLHKNLPLTAALHKLSENGMHFVAWCHDFAWKDELYTSDLHEGYPWNLLSIPWNNIDYITVSEDRQVKLSKLLKIPKETIQVITPGIDYTEFLRISTKIQQVSSRLRLLEAAPLIILPARITRRKNIEYAIQVIHHLENDLPTAKLLVTGPPGPHNPTNLEYLKQLQDLRNTYHLEEKVHFIYELGAIDNPFLLSDNQMAELYQLADLLIFPSRREGFGIPVLEASLSRIPVFASNIPTVLESTHGYAHLFEPDGNPQNTARSIYLWTKTNQEYALRKRVLNQFTWQAILNHKILPLIEKVVSHEELQPRRQIRYGD